MSLLLPGQRPQKHSAPLPSRTREQPQTLASVVDITKEQYKTIYTGIEQIDREIGGLEEGINIIYGPTDAGKTNFCLHLTFNCLEGKGTFDPYSSDPHRPFTVKYLDIERGVHAKRVMDIYKARNCPFEESRLKGVFVRLQRWRWGDVYETAGDQDKSGFLQECRNILQDIVGGTPDVFIIDAITPIFLDRWRNCPDDLNWEILGSREQLCFDMLKTAHEKHIIIIIVAHEKGGIGVSEQKKDWESEELPFSGLGFRFAFSAKCWIRVMKHTSANSSKRYFLLEKSRFLPDYSVTKKTVPFKIVPGGIDYAMEGS